MTAIDRRRLTSVGGPTPTGCPANGSVAGLCTPDFPVDRERKFIQAREEGGHLLMADGLLGVLRHQALQFRLGHPLIRKSLHNEPGYFHFPVCQKVDCRE
jgi:hypothetical protein